MIIQAISLKGHRDQNEDKHDIITNIKGTNQKIKDINFFAVYDGHGGKDVSAFLKDNLSKYFLSLSCSYPLKKQDVYNIYDTIQKKISIQPYSAYTGSTALVAIMFKQQDDTYLNILNTGDCRCIICRDNFALPLTKDHKPHWPEENRRIIKTGGKIVFDGFDFRIKDLSVSRAFGDTDATPFVSHRPDIFRYKIEKSDKFIVLACDGLWDVLSNDEVVNFILITSYDQSLTKRIVDNNVNVAKKLAEYALTKGSTDNISVIIAFFY
jgi:protein phosphatase PTC1